MPELWPKTQVFRDNHAIMNHVLMPGSLRPAPNPMEAITVEGMTLVNAFGFGCKTTAQGLEDNQTALTKSNFPGLDFDTWIGRIPGIEAHRLPRSLSSYDARNNRIIDLALDQDGFRDKVRRVSQRFGKHRIGVIVGTSTSGILETERAYRRRNPENGSLPQDFRYQERQNTSAPAAFVRESLGLSGPAWAISTACSSSSKALASAARLLAAGWCDAVVAGGSDSLCLTTLYGFHSLELLASEPCRPMDQHRQGISIGEAAGFMLLVKGEHGSDAPLLLGYGESADAFHMSSPHPEGTGAALAISDCLARANLDPEMIDFTLLHGTATRSNDVAEDLALRRTIGPLAHCASIKGAIGHTLGAAGIQNAIVACLCIKNEFTPGTSGLEMQDPHFLAEVFKKSRATTSKCILSNAFGFGGSNAALVFGYKSA